MRTRPPDEIETSAPYAPTDRTTRTKDTAFEPIRNQDCPLYQYRQHGDYLEVFYDGTWNPSDYAHHLSRRARGLPFWFSLAVHGTRAYADAVEKTLDCAREAAAMIEAHPRLEMVTEQRLSICVFRRPGWSPEDYKSWSDALLERGDGLVTPTKHEGKTVLRFCIVNPRTTRDDIQLVLDSL